MNNISAKPDYCRPDAATCGSIVEWTFNFSGGRDNATYMLYFAFRRNIGVKIIGSKLEPLIIKQVTI